jgi:hypothetical protein
MSPLRENVEPNCFKGNASLFHAHDPENGAASERDQDQEHDHEQERVGATH